MIEQGLFKRYFVGRDGFIWWIGQIVSEEKWAGNTPGYRTKTTDDRRGFSERYKVRIMGYHTANKKELTDDQLPWASVIYPVTAGSGGAGTWSNAALRQGSFVFGFFLDGEDAQQPVIMGVIGFNEYTALSKQDNTDVAFFPFSGFTNTDTVPRYSFRTTQEEPKGTQINSTQKPSNVGTQEFVSGYENKEAASNQQKINGQISGPIPQPSTVEKVPLNSIQRRIKNLVAEIERINKTVSNWEAKVTENITNVENEIKKATDKAAKFIAEGMKWLINEIQKYTTNKINNATKDTYYNLFPNQRPELKKAIEQCNDSIACLFRTIIDNLVNMVSNLLSNIVNRLINTPLCAVENIVGSLIGKLAGLIISSIDAVLGPIKAIVGGAFDLAGGILNFITDLFSSLACDDSPSQPQIKEWSIWSGSSATQPLNLNSLINKVETVASGVSQVIDPTNFNFDNLDFGDVFDSLGSCDIGPTFCGPPLVEFFGGGGLGAEGNAIVSSAGNILGVDITNPGSGYLSAPFINFNDLCGTGNGASGRVVISNGQVVNVIIDEPGVGYLPSPNGNRGGDGRTWATANQTTVKRNNGVYDTPYDPGDVFTVFPGDQVYSFGVARTITDSETITAPQSTQASLSRGESPGLNTGKYPVILEIGDVNISKPGFGYDKNDKIIIIPDNGVVMKPEYDDLGSLTKVNLISSGEGFKEFPQIYIESDTGYNAKIIPIFNIRRVDPEKVDIPENQIINVIDCVGKV